MNRVEQIDRAVRLDLEIKAKTAELDQIKSELQAEALQTMENKNTKYVEYFGTNSSAVVCYKEKFEVDNLPLLEAVLGEVLVGKIKKEESVKITLDSKIKKAVMALYRGDYSNIDVLNLLGTLGLDSKQAKAAAKKLSGDYSKDIQVLRNFGLTVNDGAEEELDAIRAAKNYELVTKFVEIDKIDLEKLKRAVSVEESLSVGIVYDAEAV